MTRSGEKDCSLNSCESFPCKFLTNLLNNVLKNRLFVVHNNELKSSKRILNNGLPQGSVLAPLLFNLYTHDIPDTVLRKCIYTDDICIACSEIEFNKCKQVLNSNLHALDLYFKQWRLKPNPSKTETSAFHLNN